MKKGLFYRLALFLYERLNVGRYTFFVSGQVETDLVQLHPGESLEQIKAEYYAGKLTLFLEILLIGSLFAGAVGFKEWQDVRKEEGVVLRRGSPGEDGEQVKVQAVYGETAYDFEIQLSARQLSEEEAGEVMDELSARLPEYILGENESLDSVALDLQLWESYDSFPVTVEWESSHPDIVDEEGKLQPAAQSRSVELTAILFCGAYTREETIEVTVLSEVLSAEEKVYRELEEYLIETERATGQQDTMRLPDNWNGREVVWSRSRERRAGLLWCGTLAAAVLVYFFSDRDLHGKLEKRRKTLTAEYPDLIHELVLLVGAGMTTKSALLKMAADYEKKKVNGGKTVVAYEELLYMCREMQSGVAEGAAYERFGRRAGVQQYIRLSGLLIQNLKHGNSSLPERLREEACKAGEEKLQQSKRLGEEAGTKLLVPMVMMLAVVMALIMLPAFAGI